MGHGVSYSDYFEKEQNNILHTKTVFQNVEGYSKKYRRPYFIVIKTIDKHCSVTVKPVLIKKKSNYSSRVMLVQ